MGQAGSSLLWWPCIARLGHLFPFIPHPNAWLRWFGQRLLWSSSLGVKAEQCDPSTVGTGRAAVPAVRLFPPKLGTGRTHRHLLLAAVPLVSSITQNYPRGPQVSVLQLLVAAPPKLHVCMLLSCIVAQRFGNKEVWK